MENKKKSVTTDFSDIQNILSLYGLKASGVDRIRKIYLVRTNQGIRCLKKSRLSRDELLFIHEVKEYLAQKGFPTTDRFLLTKEKMPFAVYGNDIYTLTQWVPYSREIDYKNPRELLTSIHTLSKLHRLSENFQPAFFPEGRRLWGEWPERFKNRFDQLQKFYRIAESKKKKSAFDEKFLRYYPDFERQGETFLKLLPYSPYHRISEEGRRRRNICHHDYSCRNILITPCRQVHLIDFDYCICDIRIHDLGSLIIRNMKTNNWELDLARFILKNYHNFSPLTREEFEVLWLFFIWPQDFWQIGLQYYVEMQPWPKKKFQRSLNNKTNDLNPRINLIQRFPDLWPIR